MLGRRSRHVADGKQSVQVPLDQVFDRNGVLAALSADGPLPRGPASSEEILAEMLAEDTGDPGFDLSFFDLFFNGLTDIGWSVYFGMDLVSRLIEYKATRNDVGWGIGAASYDFLDQYVGYLIARDLARVDFDAWRHTATVLGMTGTFIASLTSRGREIVEADRARQPNSTRDGPLCVGEGASGCNGTPPSGASG
jgi:hypothetical protein